MVRGILLTTHSNCTLQGEQMAKGQRIGILHPGEMGISIAASAKNSGCEVYWTSEGRSPATRERAANVGLHEAKTLGELCKQCSIIVSVCPPHAAEALADQVVNNGFHGLLSKQMPSRHNEQSRLAPRWLRPR